MLKTVARPEMLKWADLGEIEWTSMPTLKLHHFTIHGIKIIWQLRLAKYDLLSAHSFMKTAKSIHK